MKKLFVFGLSLLNICNGFSQGVDTFYVYFSINETKVTDQESQKIDSLISSNLLVPGHKMRVLGYADYLGSVAHNDSLSRERAKNVEEQLLASGFDRQDITLCLGEGEIPRTSVKTSTGYAADRKVLIIADRQRQRDILEKKKKMIDINDVKVNETIALKNIYFEGSLPVISRISFQELEQLHSFLKENKNVTIQIEGHICCLSPQEGTDEPYDNSTLSTMRAKAVYDYLVSKGIDKTRLKYIGLGNTKPSVTPELSEEDMERNRRVEIRILSK